MNNRTEAKLTDLSGMQKGIEEILKQAWERGRKYGQNEERPQGDLISREALKKAVEDLVVGGAETLKDYYENGSKSEEYEWIGGVYNIWELIVNAPTADDWQKYSDELWKNAYERGKADAYEKAKQKVTVSVKVGNETVETIEINGDAVRWSSSSL